VGRRCTDAGLHRYALIERRCGIGQLTDPPERLALLRAGKSLANRWIR
jgi:hypothetical protein